MDIKSYTNKYNSKVADCPFCDKVIYVRPITKVSPDPLRDLKRHITNQAKNETFLYLLNYDEGEINKIEKPHFDYYKNHTEEMPVINIAKRRFNDDLTLK